MQMCHWRRAKPSSSNTFEEERLEGQRESQQEHPTNVERRGNINKNSGPPAPIPPAPHPQGGPMSTRRSSRQSISGPPVPTKDYPRSSSSSAGVGRASASIRSIHSPPRAPGAMASQGNETCSHIETIPNELLETIFLLAIATSFPTEDPNWPLSPMFSKRSYHHSPSNSHSSTGFGAGFVGSGDNNGHTFPSLSRERTLSAGREHQAGRLTMVEALTSAPHLLPTVLSQTCTRFRIVLRNAPHLWSYISVTRITSPQPHQQSLTTRQLLGWLPLYLARSRDAYLHLTLDTTKFGSFSGPLSSSSSLPAGPSSTSIHSHSILALLLPSLSRWCSLTLLASHIGSPSLAPLLHLLSPLRVPSLAHLRVSADRWRPGIVGYGVPLPAVLFSGGSPKLESIVLEGVNLDWRSCLGFSFAPNTSGSGDGAMNLANMTLSSNAAPSGLFNTLRNLELRFIAGRYPRWEDFAQLLEQGCPNLQRLVFRDNLEEVLRAINPPALPYFEDHRGPRQPGFPLPPSQSPIFGTETARRRNSNSNSSGGTSTSTSPASGRFPTHLAGLHLTLPQPPPTDPGRPRSQSASSSTSSGSSSSSSSPTSPYYQNQAGSPHNRRRRQREFRKILLPNLNHLEIHAYYATGGILNGSQSGVSLQQAASPSGSGAGDGGGRGGEGAAVEKKQPPAIARFLYLLSTPSIHTLALSGLARNEWVGIAGMLGVSSDLDEFTRQRRARSSGRSSRGSRGSRGAGGPGYAYAFGSSYNTYEEATTFPYLTNLEVVLSDG